jgi:hypothetical protein
MRRGFAILVFLLCGLNGLQSATLPPGKVFVNRLKFDALVAKARAGGWERLPLGARTARVGLALAGTPYVNYTLELHDRIEAPSVNMEGMDCWTFFEIALGTARALGNSPSPRPEDLLAMVEMDRYRGGRSDGTFLSRLHHLEDWSHDNARRGLVEDITPQLPGARRLQRDMAYMGKNWKSFRQLRANPSLVPKMQRIEKQISDRGIYYIPKAKVAAAEKHLRDGDVVSIVTTWPGTYTSHVGLAVRDKRGVLRFLHASRNHRKVVLDERLSTYLAGNSKHMGIFVSRPIDKATL